nr:reverse transcriptase domain-containing protein [Tanacetum cinerariifolium]
MSNHEQTAPSQPTSALRNTVGRAEKFNQEKNRNEKLKEVKARLNFEERSKTSRYSESMTRSTKEHERRYISRRSRSPRPSVFSRIKRDRSRSSTQNSREKEGGVFKRLGNRRNSVSARSCSHNRHSYSMYTEALSESKGSGGGNWKSRSNKKKSSREEDDLFQPRVCEERDPFTPNIRYFDFSKTRMPSHIKTYDGSEDPEDHLKKFQAAAKTERWPMPTWCHMFNSTLTGNARVWFDVLLTKSIDSYDDLKKAFMENYLQQKKCIKDPIELHNIKQRDGESTEDFVRRFRNQQRPKRKQDPFTVLTKTPKEIFALEKGKFKASPPMTTLVEKQNHTKFCEFHGEVGHNTDKCMHLKKEIEEMLKAGKLSHLIKELKQNSRKEQPKAEKKGETSGKDKALSILMVQPWERVARQKITQSFSSNSEILFPPLDEDKGTECPMIIKAEIGGHCIHRITLRFGLDELRGGKVTISVQQNYWKTRSQKTISSSVNNSQNVEAPGIRRSNYPKKQWDGPVRMRVDAYEGYHQIQMAKEDEEKTMFITSQGIFCYVKMPFGLRNAGATYQRLVNKAFYKQIGRNLKVYVADLVIKSRTEDKIVRDIEETFKTLREINMKLNLKKCAFGVEEWMFLGYKVNNKGLKVCPDKVDVVLCLPSPKCLKDVQKLNGKLASLNRFLAKSAKKSLP